MHVVGEGLRADGADRGHAHALRLVALLDEQVLRGLHDAGGALRAVRQIGALLAIGGDEDAVEALLHRVHDPAGLDCAGARQIDDHHLGRVVHVRTAGQVDARVGDVVGAEDQDPRVVRLAFVCLGLVIVTSSSSRRGACSRALRSRRDTRDPSSWTTPGGPWWYRCRSP